MLNPTWAHYIYSHQIHPKLNCWNNVTNVRNLRQSQTYTASSLTESRGNSKFDYFQIANTAQKINFKNLRVKFCHNLVKGIKIFNPFDFHQVNQLIQSSHHHLFDFYDNKVVTCKTKPNILNLSGIFNLTPPSPFSKKKYWDLKKLLWFFLVTHMI